MGKRRDEIDDDAFARESGTRRTAGRAVSDVPILPPEPGDPTRDLAQELAEVREGRALEPRLDDDASTRFFVIERDVLAAAESALATLTARRSLRSAPFGIYVYGAHDPRGLHVGGRRFDLAPIAGPIASLRATATTASFELRVAPYLLFGSTVAGATVLAVCARLHALPASRADALPTSGADGSETARTIASTFALLFHGALAAARPKPRRADAG